jgi:hypothetical protein
VQFVNKQGIARFSETVGKGWYLEPVELRMRSRQYGEKEAYESWKAATSSKISGRIKLRRDQSSAKLFWKTRKTVCIRGIKWNSRGAACPSRAIFQRWGIF